MYIIKSMRDRNAHKDAGSLEATSYHLFGLRSIMLKILVTLICLMAVSLIVSAEPQSCPVTYSYYPGQHVSLTASPSGSGYSYDWTSPGITRELGGFPWIFSFIVPYYYPALSSYTIILYTSPTNSPEACKDRCEITINVLPRASLGDFVWDDLNGNGIHDPGEPGITGVKVELINTTTGLVVDTQSTNPTGHYLFTDILPGDYYVRFSDLPAGYYFSPQNVGGDDAKDSDPDATTGETGIINLVSGESDLTVDAGVIHPASLGDYVWIDINNNGIQDQGESGKAGVTVELLDSTGTTVLATITTDANGYYSFTNLEPGTYIVRFILPSGNIFSPQNAGGDDAIDSDPDISGQTEIITLTSGESENTWDAGLVPLGEIIVIKETRNGDDTFSFTGTAPATSPWPAGCGLASFTLSNGQSKGCSDLAPGSYTITEAELAGWSLVDIVFDNPDDGSSIDLATGTATIDLDPGEKITVTFTNEKLQECWLELNKTALNETVERGQDIYYSIDLCSSCGPDFKFTNVTVWDVLPNDVQLVSVDPPASLSGHTLTWDLGTFPSSPYQRCFNAVVVVRVPVVNMSYDMEQGVQGEGFVNVHNDYDTHHEPKSLTNCAYAKADLQPTISSCASSRVVDPGTELRRREFGSGTYASEELTRVRMENKSIQSATSLSASHKPTTFSLPGGSSITYGSKWTEKSKGFNYATGATMNEEYTFANKIDKERVVDLDKNGSTMKTDVSFTGTGHIGVLKKDEPDSHPKVKPTYEATEDYTGSFQVNEMVDEYGSNVRSDKSVTGYGYAAVDKRVSNNQRTYESGTGSYQSDEKIETASNYIAKDISLVYGPTNYSYTPSFATNQDIKWSEGMWSKSGVLAGGVILAALPTSGCGGEAPANTSAPATYISERYSSLNYLDKETVAAGLNEMKTNASFSGMADFRAKVTYSNKTGEIDNEERYVGDYDITRKVQITGVSKYGRPHITVTKEGDMTTRFFNKTMANVAEYTITIVNDGNVALAPINIRDIFPPGTEYIYSSIRPDSYSNSEANWSLMNLGVGNSIQLELTLNVTRYAPANLVNRVMVCGINGDEGCVSGSAYFVLESGDLTCCPPEVVLDKVAEIDANDTTLVHYTIVVQNNANATVAATLTDMLPVGLNYMSATNEPDIQNGQFLQWIIPTLEPGDITTIEYQARATMNGAYVNEVHMDASAVDGTGYDTEDAAARIYIGSTGVQPKTTRYGGWQVPDWNMTSPDQGITVSLSPDEDSAAEFPTMYG
jgi:uncharacterized repeat protein (TIGR01451 family)